MRSYSMIAFRGALLASAVALAAFATAVSAQSYDLRVVHNFSGAPDDGMFPEPGVQFDSAGNLYGTTQYGGAFDGGTIYKIAKDGTESILYSFEPANSQSDAIDSEHPNSVNPNGIVIDSSTGDIYGSTMYDVTGHGGQIYKLAADGTFTTLYTFGVGTGLVNLRGLIRDPQGNLYGIVNSVNGPGVQYRLFKFAVDGTFTVLHAFVNASPLYLPLIRDKAGNLYGAAAFYTGGGAIYKVAPDGTFTTLYLFANGVDGSSSPSSGLAGDQAGNLYGATMNHASSGPRRGYWSTVFKLAPDGTFTTIYASRSLPSNTLVPYVYAVLPVDGTVYGLSSVPAITLPNQSLRTLFTIAPDGAYTKLHDFLETNSYGNFVDRGPLVLEHGRVYGTIKSTGISPYGTIFSLGITPQ